MFLALAPIAGHHIITWIVIGLIAGLVAAKVVDGGGLGFFRDTITGIAGAIIGGFILHAVRGGSHASTSLVVEIVVAFVGAVILLLIEKSLTHGGSRRRRYGRI
ncbi:MAG TPA: GlsB/YeaQ/YmgE family stress response membrane protein [Acidimicrobiales bacterium]|jgi:uncharacterized membrane protein YeaQ/YmgE (transglycosylase-associated protein family)|nr:GlsB/YeaQ/YmgE family stress response membrane protein [Acidimicrobiales bacterium]